jgi:hypothetical protein
MDQACQPCSSTRPACSQLLEDVIGDDDQDLAGETKPAQLHRRGALNVRCERWPGDVPVLGKRGDGTRDRGSALLLLGL